LHFGSLHATGDLSDRRRPVLLEEPAFGVCLVRPVNGTAAATCLKSRFVPDPHWRRAAAGSMRATRSTRTALARPRLSHGPDPMSRLVADVRASSDAGHLPECCQPRKVRAGDPVAIVDHRAHGVTVAQVFRAITLAPDLRPSILAAEGLQEGTKEMAPRWKGLRAGLGRASHDGSPGSRGMRGRGCADGGARPDRLGTGSRSGCARTWCGRWRRQCAGRSARFHRASACSLS